MLQLQRATAEGTIASLHTQIAAIRAQFEALDEESNLQSFGFYKPHYAFATSGLFEQHLETVREWQKRLLKDKRAATCGTEWTVNGSAREGKKQINQTLKLMLRAFNGEYDAAIAKVRYGDFDVHAIIYCEDAPALENRLHRVFDDRRVNRMNERKEFFRVAIEEIEAAVRECHGVVQFTHVAEAEEYDKTLSLLEQERALVADAQRSEAAVGKVQTSPAAPADDLLLPDPLSPPPLPSSAAIPLA